MGKEKKWERQTIDILSKLFSISEDNTFMKKGEQVRASEPARAGVGLTEKVKFVRLKRGERVSHVDIQGKKTLGRGHSKCKDPEVELWLPCSRECKAASVAKVSRARGKKERSEISEVAGTVS